MRKRGERGSSTIEAAIVLPGVRFILFAMVQAGVYGFARSQAAAAAEQAAVVAASESGTTADAVDAGLEVVTASGAALQSPLIRIDQTSSEVTATVTGYVELFPLGRVEISQVMRLPVERWSKP